MSSGYIAQVAGAAPNFTVVDFTQGSMADARSSDWVPVTMTWPNLDNCTQIQTLPILTVAPDGSSVNWTLAVENLPTIIARDNLRTFATNQSIAKANGGLTLPNGVQLATDSAKSGEIVDAIEAIERGWAAEPYTIQTMNGEWVSLAKSDLLAAGQAITQFRLANYAARKTCLDAINAGTITSSAQVLSAL